MKKTIAIILLTVLAVFIILSGCAKLKNPTEPLSTNTPTPGCTPVIFPDPNLEAEIRNEIGKPTGDICQSNCESIIVLDAYGSGIINLTGLEYCINLTNLYIDSNDLSDISALSGLTNLTELWLQYNYTLSDISALSGLTNLIELRSQFTNISNISALSGLTNLTVLHLSDNSISDISALSGLTNLFMLGLSSNTISDISALSGLTNLIELVLSGNSISDISALVTNCNAGGFGSGDVVDLRWNLLSAQATTVDIPYLQSQGVAVYYP